MEKFSIQLMNPNFKSVHVCAYTVPRSLGQQLQQSNEIVRLVDIGVLEEVPIPLNGLPESHHLQFLRKTEQKQLLLISGQRALNYCCNITHFLFQRLCKLTRSVQWKVLHLLQHWT
jgi:hypothetical protein